MADGNDTTPMEVDVLRKAKAKTKAKARAKRRANVEYEVFLLQGESMPERIAQSSRPGSLRRKQWVTSILQTPLRRTDGSSPWIRSMRSHAS